MKKAIIFLTGALFLAVAVTAFAEENQGFMQKLKNRFAKKPAQTANITKTTPVPKTATPSITGKAKPTDVAPSPKAVEAPIRKEDLVDSIKQTLDSNPEIISNIAGLKMTKEGDKISYTFKEASLESLDDASLQDLANKILTEFGKVQSDTINEQMNTVRQTQQVQSQINQTRQVQTQLNQAKQAQAASIQAVRTQSIPKAPSIPAAVGGKK